MNYTIEKNGARWVASNGDHHFEGDTAEDALANAIDTENGIDELSDSEKVGIYLRSIEDAIALRATTLTRLMLLKAPDIIVLNEVEQIAAQVKKWTVTRRAQELEDQI